MNDDPRETFGSRIWPLVDRLTERGHTKLYPAWHRADDNKDTDPVDVCCGGCGGVVGSYAFPDGQPTDGTYGEPNVFEESTIACPAAPAAPRVGPVNPPVV